ncbi:HPr family phosphocarrier protein [Marinivivus vitaminiproducens]|uniref:HPr family phosphocarrier protein n=1 Tax=Marinivivus vitaminiproducens TaxID=3035935 RepID=UPI0027981202|nr:HPr family phosphocarrier protein [Geminicoccaceae bacterium SCSIO 64248]
MSEPSTGKFHAVVQIVNPRGLHARAAAKFVRALEAFDAEVKVARDGMEVDGNSIMGLMMLGAAQRSHLSIRAEGPDGKAALAAVVALVEDGFGEM